jgi:hypothetical protein
VPFSATNKLERGPYPCRVKTRENVSGADVSAHPSDVDIMVGLHLNGKFFANKRGLQADIESPMSSISGLNC